MIVIVRQVISIFQSNRMIRKTLSCGFIFFLSFIGLSLTYGQKIVLSGIVSDGKTGEKLSGSLIYIKGTNEVVKTNKYGYYAIFTTKGVKQVIITHIGYLKQVVSLSIEKDTTLSFSLQTLEYTLDEVVISSDENSLSDNKGNNLMPIEQIKKMPALLSEIDALKSLQLLPGVQQGTEGTAGLHIRGGSPDQTLILIDGVPVYNAFHLFGFFSVFNSDAISNVKLYKNELPAKYGGRLSAVVDIETKEGNRKQLQKSFSISPISGKFSIEGPIKKDKSSFIIAARQTWLNVLLAAFQKLSNSSNSIAYGFHDLNAKVNFKLKNNNQLYVSFYRGRDAFINKSGSGSEKSIFQYNWGNYTGILRWNQVINQRVFQNTTLSFTNYKYQLQSSYKSTNESFDSKFVSSINDFQLRTDWDYFTKTNDVFNAGISYTLHRFRPEIRQTSGNVPEPSIAYPKTFVSVNDIQSYVQGEFKAGKKTLLTGGLHYNILNVNQKFYNNLQPRVSANWEVSKKISLRAAFFKTYQYLHLLTNSSLGLPTDLWVPITEKVPPQRSNQMSIGFSYRYKGVNFSIDTYIKKMYGLIEYQEGSTFLNDFSSQWYDKITIGNGDSKGLEVFIQRNVGKIQGFISYTLSCTNRTFSSLNEGLSFPYKYDRRHSLSLNLSHSISKNKQISITFSLQSGSLVSLPTARFSANLPPKGELFTPSLFQTNYAQFYGELGHFPNRNNFRLPIYHRLDFNYQTLKKIKKGERKWVFSIYNLYSRANPFFIYYQGQQLKQFSLLPIVPSLSYEYKF